MDQLAPYIQITNYDDRTAVNRPDGRNVVVPFPATLIASGRYGAAIAGIKSSTSAIALIATQEAARLSPSGWREAWPQQIRPVVRNAAALRNGIVADAAEQTTWRMKKLTPKISDGDSNLFAQQRNEMANAERRTYLRSVKLNVATDIALRHPETFGSAALDDWHLSGLPNELRGAIEDAVIRANLRANYAGAFNLKPSATDPFATGPDWAAVDRAVDDGLAGQAAKSANLDVAKSIFNATLDWIAVGGDMNRDAALSWVLEAA